jgi:hypothetical protein
VRDTIIYMVVPKDSLFRPAYNPDVSTKVAIEHVGKKDKIRDLPTADYNWMSGQQVWNTLPWARMGYTFDWGGDNSANWKNNKNYIGVSEFVLRPGTPYGGLNFVVTRNISSDPGWKNISE